MNIKSSIGWRSTRCTEWTLKCFQYTNWTQAISYHSYSCHSVNLWSHRFLFPPFAFWSITQIVSPRGLIKYSDWCLKDPAGDRQQTDALVADWWREDEQQAPGRNSGLSGVSGSIFAGELFPQAAPGPPVGSRSSTISSCNVLANMNFCLSHLEPPRGCALKLNVVGRPLWLVIAVCVCVCAPSPCCRHQTSQPELKGPVVRSHTHSSSSGRHWVGLSRLRGNKRIKLGEKSWLKLQTQKSLWLQSQIF